MKINVRKNALEKTISESKEAKEKSIQNMNKEKFPTGLAKLVIVDVEHTSFEFNDKKTDERKKVQKIILKLNTALKNSKNNYFDFRMEFPFFTFEDKETGDPKCISFEQLYGFIDDAFGKQIQFKNEEADLEEIATVLTKGLEHFKGREIAFYGIVIHREIVYKDRLILSPELYMPSITSITGDIKKAENLDKSIKNKVWKISETTKKKVLAKKRNQSASLPNQNEEGIPSNVDNFSADMNSIGTSPDKEDDLPF